MTVGSAATVWERSPPASCMRMIAPGFAPSNAGLTIAWVPGRCQSLMSTDRSTMSMCRWRSSRSVAAGAVGAGRGDLAQHLPLLTAIAEPRHRRVGLGQRASDRSVLPRGEARRHPDDERPASPAASSPARIAPIDDHGATVPGSLRPLRCRPPAPHPPPPPARPPGVARALPPPLPPSTPFSFAYHRTLLRLGPTRPRAQLPRPVVTTFTLVRS
jgi:hypothetical protein